MSLAATSWVLKTAKVGDPVAKLILFALADRAAEDGTAAWPSNATLAEYAEVSGRTVIRKLQMLQERGLIQLGDQELVSHYRADRRPRVWDLQMSRGDNSSPRERGDTVTSPRSPARGDTVLSPREAERGDTGDVHGVTAVSHKTSFKPSLTTESSLRSDSAQKTSRDLVGEWIDHCNGERPPGRVVGQISKEIGAMLREGIPYRDVRTGLQQWQLRGLHPSALASVVHEMRTAHSGGLKSRRQLETDSQFERMFARAKQLDQEHADPKEIEQ